MPCQMHAHLAACNVAHIQWITPNVPWRSLPRTLYTTCVMVVMLQNL